MYITLLGLYLRPLSHVEYWIEVVNMFSFKNAGSMMTFEGQQFQGKDAIAKKISVSCDVKFFELFYITLILK